VIWLAVGDDKRSARSLRILGPQKEVVLLVVSQRLLAVMGAQSIVNPQATQRPQLHNNNNTTFNSEVNSSSNNNNIRGSIGNNSANNNSVSNSSSNISDSSNNNNDDDYDNNNHIPSNT